MADLRDIDVSGMKLGEVPAGASQDTVDDHFKELDGTDPADNLLPVESTKDDGLPSAQELTEGPQDAPDEPVEPARDEDEEEGEEKGEEKGEGTKSESETDDEEDAGEDDEGYTEADAMQESGRPGFETFGDYAKAEDTAFNELRSAFKAKGVDLFADNAIEALQEMAAFVAKAPATDPSPQPKTETKTSKDTTADDAHTVSMDDVFERFDNIFEDGSKKQVQKFYSELGRAVVAPLNAKIKDLEARLGSTDTTAAQSNAMLALDMSYYARAKAQAGDDDAIPSFAEAKRLLDQNPQLREKALYRLNNFGDEKANPFDGVFAQWRVQKGGTGLSNAERKVRKASAGKVRKFSRTKTSGKPASRSNQPKTSLAKQIVATRNLPADILNRIDR